MPTTSYPLLTSVNDPADLRRLSRAELKVLSTELRAFVLESVAKTGGHLSSNLGTVELTVALHHVFNTPYDRLVWGAFRDFRSAPKAPTTPSVPPIRAPVFRPRWAWRWPPGTRVKTGARWPSLAMAP